MRPAGRACRMLAVATSMGMGRDHINRWGVDADRIVKPQEEVTAMMLESSRHFCFYGRRELADVVCAQRRNASITVS